MLYNIIRILQKYNSITKMLNIYYNCVNIIDILKITDKIYNISYRGLAMRVISGTARGTKLNSIDSLDTRPTLDRVKESLFNIIQNKIESSIVLDLFAGSGAIGIEFISRGSKKVYFCEKSHNAVKMIYQNLKKTRFEDKSEIFEKDYKKCLEELENRNIKFDIIFLDPPYEADLSVKAIEQIISLDLLNKEGIIIIETDEEERDLKELERVQVEIYDLRKYGRVHLIFLNRKE